MPAQSYGAVFSLLRQVPFLALLPARAVESMARNAVHVSIPHDEAVIREGQSGDMFYVVGDGTAIVTRAGELVRHLRRGNGSERSPCCATSRAQPQSPPQAP